MRTGTRFECPNIETIGTLCLCENETRLGSYFRPRTRALRKEECIVIGYGKRSVVLLHPRSGLSGIATCVPLEYNSEVVGRGVKRVYITQYCSASFKRAPRSLPDGGLTQGARV